MSAGARTSAAATPRTERRKAPHSGPRERRKQPRHGFARLPRQTRDTLFVLGAIGLTLLPHLFFLPLWCSVLSGLVLAWRGSIALHRRALPSRWTVIALLGFGLLLTFWSHRTLVGRDAGITLLALLLALKTLELQARRDALVIFFLGFFITLLGFMQDQSLPMALAAGASVWALLSALVLAHMPVGQPPLRQAALLAARTLAFGLPPMLALFVLFPRVGPLWGLPGDAMARTGMSGQLQMGSVAELAGDDAIAFRAQFGVNGEGQRPPNAQLYWRGPVMSRFDGSTWEQTPAGILAGRPLPQVQSAGQAPLAYRMLLEPSRLTALPLLETTATAPSVRGQALTASLRADGAWQASQPVAERLMVQGQAQVGAALVDPNMPADRERYLQLPEGESPRTRAWAQSLLPPSASAGERVAAVLAHIRRERFIYTLAPGSYGDARGRQAIDAFWLGERKGFCEHYAASFVFILRAMGVPARIVTGYQGADDALQAGWLVVRQNHAHAWTEVWLEGEGESTGAWVRVDPTAAVAPNRVQAGQTLAPPPTAMQGLVNAFSPSAWADLRGLYESVDAQWKEWVIHYSSEDQFSLLASLGIESPSWQDLAVALGGLIAALGLGGAAWSWWDRRRQSPWQRITQRIRTALTRAGVSAPAHASLRALAMALNERHGAAAEGASALLRELDAQRYGREAASKPPKGWWAGFARALTKAQQQAGAA